MQRKPRRGRGYLYRTSRKFRFLLRRGSLFQSAASRAKGKRRDHTLPAGTFTLISINSLFLFLLSYVIVFMLYGLTTALAAYAFNIPTVLNLTDISFMIKGVGWSADAVKVVYSAGPLVSLIAGVILIILYNIVAEENGIARLLVLWMFAHCSVFFFGEIMMGSLFSRGFGFVLMYLYANDTVMMVVTVLALMGMVAVGFRFARLFVVSANIWFNELPAFYLRKFLVFQFFLPFIAGNAIIVLLKLPAVSPYETGMNLTMLFLLIPVMIQGSRLEDFYFDEDPRKVRLSLAWILAALLFLAAFRVVLGEGLKFLF